MNADLIEFTERQFQFLLSQGGTAFLRELRRTLEALRREPRIAAILDDEKRMACVQAKSFGIHCEEMKKRLVLLKQDLVRLAPDIDDSDEKEPIQFDYNDPWFSTFACFNGIANGQAIVVAKRALDKSAPTQLLYILKNKIESICPADSPRDEDVFESGENPHSELDSLV
ncbi:hypothetical protein [Melittangium boletus]|uniref:hypothetical protein n=1 Tax=Melittangium boletus TaxID=83453 RepID=UPI003DA3F682